MDKDITSNHDPNSYQYVDPSFDGYNIPQNFQQFSPPPNYHQLPTFSQRFQQFPNNPQGSNSHQFPNPRGISFLQQFPNSQQFFNSQIFPNSQQLPTQYYGHAENFNQSRGFQPSQRFPSPSLSVAGLDMINLNDESNVNNDDGDITLKRKGFTSKESEVLATCWADISIDSLVGNNKKQEQYWQRITDAYNKNKPKNTMVRTLKMLKSHFMKLQKETKSFSECYARCCAMSPSCHSDADIMEKFEGVSKPLILRIASALEANDEYFQLPQDVTSTNGFTSFQKCTVALRQMATGGGADQYDEYLRVAKSTGNKCLKRFCWNIIQIFGPEYLRNPTTDDRQRLLRMHKEKHGFPGMLGSLDCMHWAWENRPVAWEGQFTRDDQGRPTIILEAVASQDSWIWHGFFGVAGSNNDINVLNQSPLFNDTLQGNSPQINFTANGVQYNQGYYLVDGIYPEWPTFVKTIPHPTDDKRRLFKMMQEAARKDVERAFGVLQKQWAIVRGPCHLWFSEHIKDIILACIIAAAAALRVAWHLKFKSKRPPYKNVSYI